MREVIAHRGPDDSGIYLDSHAALGHQRLSIIDISAGHQPMANEDETLWITYNGEIFNHSALRSELEKAGHRYQTRCDTETILHAYEEYGADCVRRFRGMFSFAIWDRRNQCLFCVRDRLGIKPFYYFWDGRLFAFASEIKALLQHPEISASLNDYVVPEYLAFGYLSGAETMFRGICKLMPGHQLTIDLRTPPPQLVTSCYWDVPPPERDDHRDDRALISECRHRLEEAVQMRLMSDVPLGLFLSGGVDSSAIAALMQRMSSSPIKTFSVGYHEAKYSELDYAKRVARAIGSDHHTISVTREQFFSTLPRVIWHEDEPAVFSSSVPLYFVSKLASEHVKVVLSGEGSDELFAGYERYRYYDFNAQWAAWYNIVPGWLRTRIRNHMAISSLLSGDMRRKLQHTFIGRENTVESLQFENFYCAFSRSEIAALSSLPGINSSGLENVLGFWDKWPSASPLARMLYADQKTYLVELLMRQDQMSMAWSIESRVPLLDHPFVEFAMRLPERLKLRSGEQKYILKKAIQDLLPPEIIYRRKMGFPTPLRQWFGGPDNQSILSGLLRQDSLLASVLDLSRVEKLIAAHRQGAVDATDRIWRLLNLQIWGDIFLKGKCEAPERFSFSELN
jgi:asparagine synthase (glutamine-hydrolysing)